MSQRTRRQHTVARTYLSGFADERGQVVMHRRSGKIGHVSIGDATVRRDFYTYMDDDGNPNEAIEGWMAKSVEGPAAKVLRDARAGVSPSRRDVAILARFAAVSLLRTSTARSLLSQIDTHIRPIVHLQEAIKRSGQSLADLSDSSLWTAVAAVLKRRPLPTPAPAAACRCQLSRCWATAAAASRVRSANVVEISSRRWAYRCSAGSSVSGSSAPSSLPFPPSSSRAYSV